ncbi:MAG: PDR/VanB family oxidoreductase [Pseudomonadota bacterium]
MTSNIIRVRVARKQSEALDICSFELVALDGPGLPPFSAGSHIDVHLEGGVVRQYSLCNDPTESHRYLIAVLRDPQSRGGSAGMHSLQEGATLEISAPKNHFPLAHEARSSLLLAGGIGITPLLCMAERLAATGAQFDLHYCGRSRERAAFLDRIQRSAFAQQVHLHFDDDDAAQRFDIGARLATWSPGQHLYVCGPKGYMDAVLAAARAHGWPEQQLHYEFFSAGPIDTANDASFEVQVASSGKVIRVGKDQTVIQALAANGVELPYSCEQGVCGTCVTRVLEGEPDHKDMYLSPQEQARNDQFTPCCSRARSARLVLDL